VSEPIQAAGAPFDQGVAQGRALQTQIAASRAELRSHYGPLAWQLARRNARERCGRPLQRFLPQMHERLRGIAAGAELRSGTLELAESLQRTSAAASACGSLLEARIELGPELASGLALRHSRPDAVGYASVELIGAAWTGCLAGVNEVGLAVAVTEDRFPGPSLRSYAQDLLLRSDSARAAAGHLELRARYGGGDGALIAADSSGAALRLELRDGQLHATPLRDRGVRPEASTVRLDAAARTLEYGGTRLEPEAVGPQG
jgi:hypothetical protein